ncbi:GNAT family N-acetyltransferase [Fictibacillus fluitans]|uniref:GNAT family N-acetyltransferase n=1 Tax=Fictibacillus fluitans TaxID=3058422 RepID=A0ABT8HVB7_9BACL|nr:GNAT family N-acetyltransferase [Fictibacillus sp. NE201]MDN4524694.1 GNAT family N-acetyltransferase [Fictibacillus sp. NE201]
MEAIIRMSNKGDEPQLKALMLQYIVDFYKSPKPSDQKLDDLIAVLMEREQGLQFVAEQDGTLKGFATLYFTYSTTRADKIVVMNDLYVAEDSRGSGAAAGLFQACKRYADEYGYAAMLWETAEDNQRAQRFYEKMGGHKGDFLTYSI